MQTCVSGHKTANFTIQLSILSDNMILLFIILQDVSYDIAKQLLKVTIDN
jgi:hypothetical protein